MNTKKGKAARSYDRANQGIVPPAGVEPASLVPKTSTLSVKLRGRVQIIPHSCLAEKRDYAYNENILSVFLPHPMG